MKHFSKQFLYHKKRNKVGTLQVQICCQRWDGRKWQPNSGGDDEQREKERAPKMKIENEMLFVLLVFTFTKPTQFPNQNLNFNRELEGIWYMHLKIYVLLFESMCENTCGWQNVWKNI